jgi:hypothetical protein
LWKEGLLEVNKHFLFGAGTREYGHPDPSELGRQGIEDGHAYSVLRAVEYEGNRLLMIKNPWGETEWYVLFAFDFGNSWRADLSRHVFEAVLGTRLLSSQTFT